VIIKKGFCSGNISQIDGVVTCLRAIYEHPDIASVTVGTINTAHLESNIKSAKQILGVH
jgi:predicted aldo/keto reductase-like oxidoreductase